MIKQKTPSLVKKSLLLKSGIIIIAATLGMGLVLPRVDANSISQQISALEQENSNNQSIVAQLEEQAASYQDAINQFQAAINALQVQINANIAEQNRIKAEIAEAEAELARQRKTLGVNIKAMYLEGQITTLEMLASSKDLSEFIDKQQYRTAVQEKIKATLDKITALKLQLKAQKDQVEALLNKQQKQQSDLEASKTEQAKLLAYNQSQQNDYSNKLKQNQERINELKRQQAIENARLFGGGSGELGGGGYPWGFAKCIHTGEVEGWCYNYDWGVNGSPWNWQLGGYGYRNCTDWVAYRVKVAGGNVPSGLGNANTWDNYAPAYGYTVSGTPKVGAAAVSNSGFYGHVMYVEAVNGDGSIVVSDYNRAGTGKYAVSTLSAGTASTLSYVYF